MLAHRPQVWGLAENFQQTLEENKMYGHSAEVNVATILLVSGREVGPLGTEPSSV